MTPRRRAALKRAQEASARKRRKGRNRKIAIGVGVTSAAVLGTATAAYLGRSYIDTLVRGGPRQLAFNPLPPQLALPPGKGTRKVVMRRPRPVHKRSGAWRVNSSGQVVAYVRRPRGTYDAKRRAGLIKGYERKIRSKYDGMSSRTQRRKRAKRG